VIVLTLAAVFVVGFAHQEISQTFDEISSDKVSDFTMKENPPKEGKISKKKEKELKKQKRIYPDTVFSDKPIFIIVEEMPEYTGGQEALTEFINNNVKYPENAQKKGIQGKVFVQFVIEIDGSVSNVKVAKGVNPELDKEAIRVVESMPKWKPGKQRGELVRVSYLVVVNF